MTIRNHAIAVVVLLLPLTATAAGAQDQFGRSVAAAGSDVLVLKPRGGRGPAAVYLFRGSASGGWTLAGELRTEAAARTGESFSASLAAGLETLLVGSGDPEGRWGAYEFTRGDQHAGGRHAEGARLSDEPEVREALGLDACGGGHFGLRR